MKKSTLLLFTGALLVLLLVACGQTGPLLLAAGEKDKSGENKPVVLDSKIQKK